MQYALCTIIFSVLSTCLPPHLCVTVSRLQLWSWSKQTLCVRRTANSAGTCRRPSRPWHSALATMRLECIRTYVCTVHVRRHVRVTIRLCLDLSLPNHQYQNGHTVLVLLPWGCTYVICKQIFTTVVQHGACTILWCVRGTCTDTAVQ